MQNLLFQYNDSQIAYYRFGRGPAKLLCFHGYGEDVTVFDFLDKCAGNLYTIYAFSLPFHGNTVWKEGLNFSRNDLLAIVNRIIEVSDSKFTLLGFSLGGRIALSLYEWMPARVEKFVLLAPDGLKINFWYWLSTQTWLGNKLFALTMQRPGWFFGLLKLMNKMGLVNASIFKFVNYYIGNKGARDLLYARWTCFRKIKPDLTEIKIQISNHDTPVRLLYGKHDRIILSSVGEKFRKGIEKQCRLSVIASGHQVLHEKHAEDILQALTG
jgi:pimeloyl-ACP methyl ester carboxylesterase